MDVADGDDLAVLVLEEGAEHLIAAVAQADEAEPDALVGAETPGRRWRGRHRGGSKLAS